MQFCCREANSDSVLQAVSLACFFLAAFVIIITRNSLPQRTLLLWLTVNQVPLFNPGREPDPAHLGLLFTCQVVSDSSVTPWGVAHQAPLSAGFSRQGYWTGLSFPPPGHLPTPGIEPGAPALAGGFFTTEPTSEQLQMNMRLPVAGHSQRRKTKTLQLTSPALSLPFALHPAASAPFCLCFSSSLLPSL